MPHQQLKKLVIIVVCYGVVVGGGIQGSRIRSVRILFFERHVRTLTYSILAYVHKNRIRSWQDEIRIISHGCYQCKVSDSMLGLI